jgi:hypothetical protein
MATEQSWSHSPPRQSSVNTDISPGAMPAWYHVNPVTKATALKHSTDHFHQKRVHCSMGDQFATRCMP